MATGVSWSFKTCNLWEIVFINGKVIAVTEGEGNYYRFGHKNNFKSKILEKVRADWIQSMSMGLELCVWPFVEAEKFIHCTIKERLYK